MSEQTQSIQAAYGETLGIRLLQELAARGLFIFSIEEAKMVAGDLGIDEGYGPQLLSQLVTGGWLRRLRRGLYAGLGRLPGWVDVHPFAVATRLVSPAAISHWSALHHHGLTEQVPRHVTASTPRKVVTPSMRAPSAAQRREGRKAGEEGGKHLWETNGVAYEYFTVTRDRFFGIEEIWVDEHFRVPIYDKERSLLDGFVAPRVFGSLSEPLGILEEHLGSLDLEKMVGYAVRLGKASIARRLGWALDRLGVPSRVTDPLVRIPMDGVKVLDPTRPYEGRDDDQWMIRENVSQEIRGGR
jgi:predicted transcriptional regulator of viral defense system